MSDLTKLTAADLMSEDDELPEWWAEIRRRLERLEKAEAALRDIKAVDPDNYASGYVRPNWESAKLIWQGKHQIALKVIQDAARAALEE